MEGEGTGFVLLGGGGGEMGGGLESKRINTPSYIKLNSVCDVLIGAGFDQTEAKNAVVCGHETHYNRLQI